MYVVGGHGYVGSRAVAYAVDQGDKPVVVSRSGEARQGVESISWDDFITEIAAAPGREQTVLWLLDGSKHSEQDRLTELLEIAGVSTYIAAASSCTVYGDANGQECDEQTPVQLVTANARLKAACEDTMRSSGVRWSSLRLGALYGIDHRGLRQDRIEKWVREAAKAGTVTVPDPTHWRGWLHRDQAARAIYRAAAAGYEGILNVASFNARFGDAASPAAASFQAHIVGDGKNDLMNYQINSDKARSDGILDDRDSESIAAEVETFRLHTFQ